MRSKILYILLILMFLLLCTCREDDPGWKRRADTFLYYHHREEIRSHNVYYNGDKLGYFVYFTAYSKEIRDWVEIVIYAKKDGPLLRASGVKEYIKLANYLDRLTEDHVKAMHDKYLKSITNTYK